MRGIKVQRNPNVFTFSYKYKQKHPKHQSAIVNRKPAAIKYSKIEERSIPIPNAILEMNQKFKKFPVLSNVQNVLISNLKRENNFIVGAQTGSGKTVGYLMGIMDILKTEEMKTSGESGIFNSLGLSNGLVTNRKLMKPRAVIIVPSRELLRQVTQVAKDLARECKLRVVGIHSKSKRMNSLLETPIDILITTPTAMLRLFNLGVRMTNCRRIIMDEADTLFDTSFVSDMQKIIKEFEGLQIPKVMVSATVPRYLKKLGEGYEHFLMPSLHKTPSTLKQEFLLLGQSITKNRMLQDVLKKCVDQTNKVIVFCNSTESADKVSKFLIEKQYPTTCLHSKLGYKELQQKFEKFHTATDFQILVATDVASRGLDTTAGQVILYDFPVATSDYIARVGRTARFGSKGRACSFITPKDVKLANYVKQCVVNKVAIQ